VSDEVIDNPTVETILQRRSTREGLIPTPIAAASLEAIVRCGLAAPSSKDAQPWRFHVVTDRDLLRGLADLVLTADDLDRYVPHDPATGAPRPEWNSTVIESAEVLASCSAAIFVENVGPFSRGRRWLLAAGFDAVQTSIVGYGLELLGLGAAVENMFLAAHSLGLGCTFMGDVVIAEDAIGTSLGIDGDLIGVLALGHCDRHPPPHADRADVFDTKLVRWYPARLERDE
jgi:nitroreductase